MGKELFPWQRYVFDTALEVDLDSGLLAYDTIVLTTPRQQGKTLGIVCLMTHRCLAWANQTVLYAAQTRDHARVKLQDDHEPLLFNSDFHDRYTPIMTNGFERLKWDNGSVWGIQATTKKSGHGPTLDMGVADEAWAQEDNRLDAAWVPAMMTRPNAQFWIPSTAGPSAKASPYLWAKVEAGRAAVEAGTQSGMAHFEWGAPPGQDPDDPATWWGCMPALGYSVTEAKIRTARASIDAADFERGYLNRWADEEGEPTTIDMNKWGQCADRGSRHGSPIALAAACSVDHKWASIAAAGPRPDGRMHLELIKHASGTDWIPSELARLANRWHPIGVGLDLGGPAGHLHLKLPRSSALARVWKPDMTQHEAADALLTCPTVREVAQSAGDMYDAIEQGSIAWLGADMQPELNRAVAGVKTRPLGDAWAWARRGSVDISSFDAITLARWVWIVRTHAYDQSDYAVEDSIF